MATIPKEQAAARLEKAVESAHPDDLVEIYNELFPERPTTEGAAVGDPSGLASKIIAHLRGGLEIEEILDLWNVVFPGHRRVWFDEEDGQVHYDEEVESVGRTET